MPRFLEDKLKREYGANSAIPYKVMNAIGAMKGNQPTAKGERMQAKHERDMGRKKPDGDRLGSGSHGFRTHKK